MEYTHDKDLLAKLFLHRLKHDALKWYFLLLEKSIDKYKNFVKKWKQTANKITMLEQDLKDTFANALFPMYKLLVISNRDMILGEMMDVLFKNEVCIKKYMLCIVTNLKNMIRR